MKAILGPTIWADPDFENLSCEAKLLVFWLLTSASRDNAGVVRISEKRISFECSIPNPNEILEEALSSGSFEMHGDRVWISNWITKQIGSGVGLVRNNMMKSVLKCVAEYPEQLQKAIFNKYPELKEIKEKQRSPSEGGSKGVVSPSEGPRKGKERKGKDNNIYIEDIKEVEKDRPPANKVDSFCDKLAKLYGSRLSAITPESKRMIWDRGMTKREEQRVLMYVKKHRAGNLKDEHPIATTANRAMINIGDLIERAFACNMGGMGYKKPKPMKELKSDDTPLTEEQRLEMQEIKEKIKKGNL
jgi:hypothetical protein